MVADVEFGELVATLSEAYRPDDIINMIFKKQFSEIMMCHVGETCVVSILIETSLLLLLPAVCCCAQTIAQRHSSIVCRLLCMIPGRAHTKFVFT